MKPYKVMIVDDEPEIRKGIEMKVDWEALGLILQAEASNGQEAMIALEQHPIDIVITDMHMPYMDGVEFLKACAEHYPLLKLIVLSGYDDFLYAKAAVRSNVKDYLLKPVVRRELADSLRKVVGELDSERQAHAERNQMEWQLSQNLISMREQLIVQTLKHTSDYAWLWRDQAKRLRTNHWNDSTVQFLVIDMDASEDRQLFLLPFELLCREIAAEWNGEAYVFRDPGLPYMIGIMVVHPEREGVDSSANQVDELIGKLAPAMQRYIGMTTVNGIGQPVIGFHEWKRGYLSALLSWNENKANINKAECNGVIAEVPLSPELEKQLVYLLKADKREPFKQELNKLLMLAERHSPQVLARTVFYAFFVMESVAQDYGITIPTEQRVWLQPDLVWGLNASKRANEYIERTADWIADRIAFVHHAPSRDLFESVKRFIDDNYGSELTLSMLAEKYHFNSSYFSELFRIHIGQTFSDYLTDIRMTKAARLLLESDFPLTEVGELCGYANPSYFSTAFKKRYRMSPSKYRNLREQ